jgi:hypothetical protein
MTHRAARPIRRSRDTHSDGWRGLVTPVRVAGLILVIASAGSVGWLATDQRFNLGSGSVEIRGLRYTDAAAVRDAIGLPVDSSTNVFLLRTDAMRRTLLALPAVAAADVGVVLPNRLVVAVTERTPVLQLWWGGITYLVDADGVVVSGGATISPDIADLPKIADLRVELAIPIEIGHAIDPTEAAAMLQIGALTPALVGSTASQLTVSVNDHDGFVVSADPVGWRAVLGFYTPTLRPPSEIAQQVQCLRSLLATGEAAIDTIYLAPQDDRCGTYLPRPS